MMEVEMTWMMGLSLLVNIVVLIPVCSGMLGSRERATSAFGPPGAARQILMSIYLAILAVSAVLLFVMDPRLVASLLLVQVVYKFTTPWSVGTFRHPVVAANIAIATLHCVTLAVIWLGA